MDASSSRWRRRSQAEGSRSKIRLASSSGRFTRSRGARRMEPQSVCQEQAPEAFTKWVRQAAVPLDTGGRSTRDRDLEVLKHAAKSARIVALGEAARRVEEFYQLRSRLLRFLVEQMGFTAFAMESGFAEGIKINDYLLGRTGEP